MLPFDVILFDVGGVLLTNGWDRRERGEVLDRFGLDRKTFEARHREAYRAWERGVAPVETYLHSTVFHEPRSFTPDDFFQAICASSKVLPDGAMGILEELAASHRYLLGTLNNEPRETNDYRFQQFGLGRYFRVTFCSCYIHLRKPDVGFYKKALDLLCSPPERILFIEDRPENVAAAQAVGMKAVRFENAAQLRNDLEALGVYSWKERRAQVRVDCGACPYTQANWRQDGDGADSSEPRGSFTSPAGQ
jgi:putative hydrolase of the HAD superfamily